MEDNLLRSSVVAHWGVFLTYEEVFDGGQSTREERLTKDYGWSIGKKDNLLTSLIGDFDSQGIPFFDLQGSLW